MGTEEGWRYDRAHRVGSLALLLAVACGVEPAMPVAEEAASAKDARSNVLFLCVDDLRPELGCYGATGIVSPHIDALAGQGVRFDRAYCQYASCGPSRVALLTGLRPSTSGALEQRDDYRELIPDCVTLPEAFRSAGWTTRALGKVHHGRGELDDPRSWSEPCWRPSRWQTYYALESSRAAVREAEETWTRRDMKPRVVAWEAAEVADSELPDGMIADEAIRFLRDPGDAPFFLVVGFLKPHLPFVAPKRYWDLYPEGELVRSPEPDFPGGAPELASNRSLEPQGFLALRELGIESDEVQRNLLRGYRACVSFVDAQVGRVLTALEEEGLADSTIVVLWGDHGWHLGDQSLWGKHTNYERALRTPLIVRVPGMGATGAASAGLVESIDLYPTLAELCGIEVPVGLDGVSFAPLLEDPNASARSAVIAQLTRSSPGVGEFLGSTIRTTSHRLIEWQPEGGGESIVELYELPDGRGERENLAGSPGLAELEADLRARLRAVVGD